MPEQPAIKWREIDLEKVRRAVVNFNKRIDYWAKKEPEIAESLPQKLSYKAVKAAIQTRQDFNREIRQIEKFNPGKLKGKDFIEIEPGVKVTKWEYKRVAKQLEQVNKLKKATAERAQMRQVSINGVPYKAVEEAHAEQKGKPVEMYKHSKSSKYTPRDEWKQFVRWVESHASEDKHKAALHHRDILISAVKGSLSGFSPDQEKLLIRLIQQADPEKLLDAYYKGREEVDPDYIYHDPEDTWKKFDKIRKYLEKSRPSGRQISLKEQLKNAIRSHSIFKRGEKNYLISLLNKIPDQILQDAADAGAPQADPAWIELAADFNSLKASYQAMI